MSYFYTLPLKLRLHGFDYTQLSRIGQICVYEQEDNGKTVGYEVFIVKVYPRQELFGQWMVEREAFPNNESFGVTAWAFKKLQSATDKLVTLVNEERCQALTS